MKNIHLIPTSQASRLKQNKITKKLSLVNKGIDLTAYTPINIYITSDEEIKFNDYITDSYKVWQWKDNSSLLGRKKVILSTDQDLIKDGVQAIDDEFLEWFVKNPSCEEVEVIEDIKYFNVDELRERHINRLPHLYSENIGYKIIIPSEEPKQETLEEAADRLAYDSTEENKGFPKIKAFKDGAKWQAERMYSKENILDAWELGAYSGLPLTREKKEKLFEQFKKK